MSFQFALSFIYLATNHKYASEAFLIWTAPRLFLKASQLKMENQISVVTVSSLCRFVIVSSCPCTPAVFTACLQLSFTANRARVSGLCTPGSNTALPRWLGFWFLLCCVVVSNSSESQLHQSAAADTLELHRVSVSPATASAACVLFWYPVPVSVTGVCPPVLRF